MKNGDFKNILGNLGGFSLGKMEPVIPSYKMVDPNKKEYHSPKEILDEDSYEYDRPDFKDWKCNVCGELIEEGYFWYYLRHNIDESKSIAVCSKECLDKLIKNGDYQNYEIYEYSRCNAYYKCQEIGNLRGICELVENKTYQSIFKLNAINHCQPAQAGTILSTHKLMEVLKDFSNQTEEQHTSNKNMMKQGAKESSKQFRITTCMTVLVIILTIANLIPTFINTGVSDYSGRLANIEYTLSEMSSTEKLNEISTEFTQLKSLIISNSSDNDEKIIELLEIIQELLK